MNLDLMNSFFQLIKLISDVRVVASKIFFCVVYCSIKCFLNNSMEQLEKYPVAAFIQWWRVELLSGLG